MFPAGPDADKYWPPVGRIDQAYGDRNLVCACPDLRRSLEQSRRRQPTSRPSSTATSADQSSAVRVAEELDGPPLSWFGLGRSADDRRAGSTGSDRSPRR